MRTCLNQHVVNKAIRVARERQSGLSIVSIARIRHARACGFKHARACGLALVLTPTKGREPLPGMAYSAYTECDTLLSLSIMHSWSDINGVQIVVQVVQASLASSVFLRILPYPDIRERAWIEARYIL